MARRRTSSPWSPGGEQLVRAPFRYRLTLSLVTGNTPDPRILRTFPHLRKGLNLTPARRTAVS
jgi:hypothetical protein